MEDEKALLKSLNSSIESLISEYMEIVLKDFHSAKSIIDIALKQKNVEELRNKYSEDDIHVPPFMIASITSKCNLRCKGCYDREKIHNLSSELDYKQWADVFSQAKNLGVSFILLAGGEPLVKGDIVKQCINFPEIIFPMFTNGVLINKDWIDFFNTSRNLIPVISIEGDGHNTNDRRGEGVFEKVSSSIDLLEKGDIFYGISITLTSENFHYVLDENFISNYINKNCRLFFFIEYIPFDASTESLVISEKQRTELDNKLDKLREKFKAMFLAFPQGEDIFGGCLAAGRGFIHINSSGAVEPCPFSPYSDINLKDNTLKEALKSPLLKEIRNQEKLLKEHKGGCSLFENKEVVEKIISELR